MVLGSQTAWENGKVIVTRPSSATYIRVASANMLVYYFLFVWLAQGRPKGQIAGAGGRPFAKLRYFVTEWGVGATQIRLK